MKVVSVRIRSDSSNHAVVEHGFVIRETTKTRLIYFPELVNNDVNPELSVRGRLVYQKSNGSNWEEQDNLSLTTLKKEEWTSFVLKTDDVFEIAQINSELQSIYDENGIPHAGVRYNFVLKEEVDYFSKDIDFASFTNRVINFSKRNQLMSLMDLIETNEENSEKIMTVLLDLVPEINDLHGSDFDKLKDYLKYKTEVDTIMESMNDETLQSLNIQINYLRLLRVIEAFKELMINSTEKECQDFFVNNSFILPMIIPTTSHSISSIRFTGGVRIDGGGYSIADFILNWDNNLVSIIEIKKPSTELINKTEYRIDVHSPSNDLSGSIVQVNKQRDDLISSLPNMNQVSETQYRTFNPPAYVIIGNKSKLNSKELKSFDFFRRSLNDVYVMTFDEALHRLELIEAELCKTSVDF